MQGTTPGVEVTGEGSRAEKNMKDLSVPVKIRQILRVESKKQVPSGEVFSESLPNSPPLNSKQASVSLCFPTS